MPTLMGMTRQEFIDNLDDSLDWLGTPAALAYSSVLPPWAQSGPWGWPMPYMNEMLFGAGKLGIETVLIPLLNPLESGIQQVGAWVTGFNAWLHGKTEECESSEAFADAVEEYAAENELGSVWAE